MIQMTKASTMPTGIVIHSGPRPKPRAVAANSRPVAIEKPATFSSSICAASPPTIHTIGAMFCSSRSGNSPRNAATAVQIARTNSTAAIT